MSETDMAETYTEAHNRLVRRVDAIEARTTDLRDKVFGHVDGLRDRMQILERTLDQHERYLSKCGGYPVGSEPEHFTPDGMNAREIGYEPEEPLPDAEPLPAPLDNAEPDDLVERTRRLIAVHGDRTDWNDGDDAAAFLGFLMEWLARAELRPTREELQETLGRFHIALDEALTKLTEARALAQEKTRTIDLLNDNTITLAAYGETNHLQLTARISELLTENVELRCRADFGDRYKAILQRAVVDKSLSSGGNSEQWGYEGILNRATERFYEVYSEERTLRGVEYAALPPSAFAGFDKLMPYAREVSNPAPEREVWSGYVAKARPDRLMTDDTSSVITSRSVFSRDKHYWITVTEVDE